MTDKQKMTPDNIDEVKTSPPSDKQALREAREFQHKETMLSLSRGWLDKFLGSRAEKAGNVSSIALIILTLFFVGIVAWTIINGGDASQTSMLSNPVLSVITLILGYLFGSRRD